MKIVPFFIKISLKFVTKVLIHNDKKIGSDNDLHWTVDKPLSEPIIALFIDAYMPHSDSIIR